MASRLVYNKTVISLGRRRFAKSLTVINYHRIGDPHQPGFDSFRPNISAHPDLFRQQLEYLIRWYNVIEARDLITGPGTTVTNISATGPRQSVQVPITSAARFYRLVQYP